MGLAVTACGPVEAGAAATVGDHRVSLDALKESTQAGYAKLSDRASTTETDFQRNVLQRQVRLQLDEDLAKDLGISVTQAEINAATVQLDSQVGDHAQLVASAAQSGVSEADIPSLVRDGVLRSKIAADQLKAHPPTQQELQSYYQQNIGQYVTFHSAHILVASKDLADQIYARVKANPSTFAAEAKKYSTDTNSKDSGGDLGTQAKGAFVAEFEDAVFAAKAGDIIGPVKTQFGYHIIRVIALTNKSFTQVRDQIESALNSTDSDYAQSLYVTASAKTAKRVGVTISSRFGSWDQATGSIKGLEADPSKALSTDPSSAAPSSAPSP